MERNNPEKIWKLPIGIQTFDKLREDGYLYVDKTKYLVDLIDRGSVYFLSRPRRFGKSLTISTFDALFSGRRELFEGLYAEEFFDRPAYRTHPVVRFDMSRVTTDQGVDALRVSMLRQVADNAERHGVETGGALPGDAFGDLLKRVAQKHGQAVVLVDEYDKPILDALEDRERAQVFRESLRNFYTQIKAQDEYIRFVFMTGITKFTKTGVFSAMNNLYDLSIDSRYATMLGYTEGELRANFRGHIAETAAALGVAEEALLSGIRDYYNGFSFDGENRVYNPFSTLSFFQMRDFRNFWFDSGSPSFLVNYARKLDLEVEDFRGMEVGEDFATVSEIELARPASFLFQSGYLTIREKRGGLLTLDYPNKEVLSSIASLFMYGKFEAPEMGAARFRLEESLAGGKAEDLVFHYNRALSAIPYDIYAREERKYEAELAKGELSFSNLAESFFHAVLFVLLWASRLTTIAENHSYKGRSDIEVVKNGHHYVIELKVAEGEDACAQAADDGMAQIKEKGYADRYEPGSSTLIALAVDRTARLVKAHRIERM